MEADPKPLARPVIVLSGIYDPGVNSRAIVERMAAVTTSADSFVVVSFNGASSFDQCAERVIAAVEAQWPSVNENETAEVDVIASSMGGLVARCAAISPEADSPRNRKRLKIARLFTISTPHRGAKLAIRNFPDQRIADMHCKSPFIEDVASQEGLEYELIPYVRLDDFVVGDENAAPPDRHPWWVPNDLFKSAHMESNDDPRILADIARRLRGEPPFTTEPATPLPPKNLGVRSFALKPIEK